MVYVSFFFFSFLFSILCILQGVYSKSVVSLKDLGYVLVAAMIQKPSS